jgi:thiamine biosynthesis lipoprotein
VERFESRSTEVSSILEEYHKLFDIYHEYSGINNLCTVNRLAGGEPVQVDAKLIDFLLYCKEIYEITKGETNILLGAVLRLWHDARTEGTSLPDPAALTEASQHTDISLLEIDRENSTIRLTDAKASIDVGALGKGYATEMAAKHLQAQGCDGYVLNIGGNIRIIGHKIDGTSWATGIKNPLDPEFYAQYLTLSDTSCVTSGDYERYFTVDGIRYHHIIDKDTWMPARYFSSVTVITPDSGLADVLSTALFAMPYEEGFALVERIGNVDVLWITPDGTQYMTDGLAAMIRK